MSDEKTAEISDMQVNVLGLVPIPTNTIGAVFKGFAFAQPVVMWALREIIMGDGLGGTDRFTDVSGMVIDPFGSGELVFVDSNDQLVEAFQEYVYLFAPTPVDKTGPRLK